MHHLTDNDYSIAWFIRQGLENAFRQKDGERAPIIQLNQELTKFTLKLPAFLYNAGYTSSIIPPGNINIKQQGRIVDISIEHVGQFKYDIQTKSVNALLTTPDEKKEPVIPEIKTQWQKRKHLVKKATTLYETNKAFATMENDI